jgi:hypothetical protein
MIAPSPCFHRAGYAGLMGLYCKSALVNTEGCKMVGLDL